MKNGLTLVHNMEARLVLRVVTVEEQSGFVGGAEEGVGHHGAAKAINHTSCLQTPTAHLQVVMNRLCGEVQKLQMDP